MTVRFRLEAMRLDTSSGPVEYAFPDDLTVLAGSTGVGKTTLLELIKFGLGGDGLIAPVVDTSVFDVHLDLRVGSNHYQLSRAVLPAQRKVVRVVDLFSGTRLPDHGVDNSSGGSQGVNDKTSIGDLLLTAMGIPTGMRAAARGASSTRGGSRITFNDIFRYIYVPQAAINRDVAGSQESYYDSKRKSVFEVLFDLTDADLLDKRSEFNKRKAELASAKNEHAIVLRFLEDSQSGSRMDVAAALTSAELTEASARRSLQGVRDELELHVDRETQVLRDLLAGAERDLAEARSLTARLVREVTGYEAERRRIEQDIEQCRYQRKK
ncbi:MAG: hypothetical protein EOO77_40935 [Oxalobacteraceae bacterium]|nr:MAG: hypothetical protein EOO77_40935 [Oxalobacteraceae bacterium]